MSDGVAVVEKREEIEPAQPARPQSRRADVAGSVGAVVVWMLIIAAIVAPVLFSREADVLLDVVDRDGLMVSGTVLVHGNVVDNGRVHVVVTNAKNKQYLASAVLPLHEGGFKTAQPMLPTFPPDQPLRIAAEYNGSTKDENITTAVSGFTTAFVNSSPPLDGRTTAAIVSSLALLLVCLIVLFTGQLTSLRARTMFAATYFMTFLSLALPIAVTVLVSQNSYLVDIMSDAPIGLVRGTAEGVAEPQWLLNIGGAVIRRPRTEVTNQQAVAPTNAAGIVTPQAGTESDSAPVVPAAGNEQAPARDGGSPAPTVARFDARAAASGAFVVGGLAVPFYIVMLAMLGAGINMTRQVPEVQMEYDREITPERQSFIMALFHAPMTVFQQERVVKSSERAAAARIRNRLIDSYMYLLAAPFLAIAVYYLLQVVATNTATPVLVLMAFSTGLISDSIVKRITKFAQETIGNGETVAAKPTDEKSQVTVTSSVVQAPAGSTETPAVNIPAAIAQLPVSLPVSIPSGSPSNGGAPHAAGSPPPAGHNGSEPQMR